MRRVFVTSAALLAVLFTTVILMVWWIARPEDPKTAQARIMEEADSLFPYDANPNSLIGLEVPYAKTKLRPPYYLYDLIIHEVHNPADYFLIEHPKQNEEILEMRRKPQMCGILDGGKVAVQSGFKNMLLVSYTPPSEAEIARYHAHVAERNFKSESDAWRSTLCSKGTIISMAVDEYQHARREIYLRQHLDPLLKRIEDEKKRIQEENCLKLLRERAERKKLHEEALKRAVERLKKTEGGKI
jgi:hypothetical protein